MRRQNGADVDMIEAFRPGEVDTFSGANLFLQSRHILLRSLSSSSLSVVAVVNQFELLICNDQTHQFENIYSLSSEKRQVRL